MNIVKIKMESSFFFRSIVCNTWIYKDILTICLCMDKKSDMDVILTTYEGPMK
jgi:hypothetical protein